MTFYAVGGEADCFTPLSGQNFDHTTVSGRFNADASRGALRVVAGASELRLPIGTTLTDLWLHAVIYQESVAAQDYIIFESAAGDPVYKIASTATGEWELSRYVSSAWAVMTTSSATVLEDALGIVDIHITRHASTGTFIVYVDGEAVASYTGDTTTDEAGVAQIHFRGLSGGSNAMNLSQVIVADESTLEKVLITLPPSANGAVSEWDGSYTDVDEFVYNPADAISTDVPNRTSTFANGGIPSAFNTYRVRGLAVAVRGRNDIGSAVDDVQAVIRVDGVNYPSSDLGIPADGETYSRQTIYETNPDTSQAWSRQEVGETQFGVVSTDA